mmetsp:Transcript_51011/g.99996  ORF Transcript_51011/g.99996 Transcript_51011/m.99996 type:complete len:256 (-) Transcript_51011:17-784(-)
MAAMPRHRLLSTAMHLSATIAFATVTSRCSFGTSAATFALVVAVSRLCWLARDGNSFSYRCFVSCSVSANTSLVIRLQISSYSPTQEGVCVRKWLTLSSPRKRGIANTRLRKRCSWRWRKCTKLTSVFPMRFLGGRGGTNIPGNFFLSMVCSHSKCLYRLCTSTSGAELLCREVTLYSVCFLIPVPTNIGEDSTMSCLLLLFFSSPLPSLLPNSPSSKMSSYFSSGTSCSSSSSNSSSSWIVSTASISLDPASIK